MSISHQVPGSSESATILQFPSARTRSGHHRDERVVAETYWMIVATAADGSRQLKKMRSPRFLSPGRAYASSVGTARGVRSLLLYKLAQRPATPAPERARPRRHSA